MKLHDEKWLEHQIAVYEKAFEIAMRKNNEEKKVEYQIELERLKRLKEQKFLG